MRRRLRTNASISVQSLISIAATQKALRVVSQHVSICTFVPLKSKYISIAATQKALWHPQFLRCQYLYSCTSKASKLTAFRRRCGSVLSAAGQCAPSVAGLKLLVYEALSRG
jgi:hypothetical protein